MFRVRTVVSSMDWLAETLMVARAGEPVQSHLWVRLRKQLGLPQYTGPRSPERVQSRAEAERPGLEKTNPGDKWN